MSSTKCPVTDCPGAPYIPRMDETASAYKEGFISRTKSARENSTLTQREMAEALQIDQGKYKQYEIRTPLPHRFVKPFCINARIKLDWLFTHDPRSNRPSRKTRKPRQPKGKGNSVHA